MQRLWLLESKPFTAGQTSDQIPSNTKTRCPFRDNVDPVLVLLSSSEHFLPTESLRCDMSEKYAASPDRD